MNEKLCKCQTLIRIHHLTERPRLAENRTIMTKFKIFVMVRTTEVQTDEIYIAPPPFAKAGTIICIHVFERFIE